MSKIDHVVGNLYEFTSYRAIDVANAELCFNQARTAERNGELETALELYHRVLTYNPSFAWVWVNIGTIWYMRQDFTKAEECYRKCLEILPNYALAHFDLGNVLDELERFPEAIESYLRAIAIDPRHSDASYNLALLHERTREYAKALKYWRLYVHHRKSDADSWLRNAQAKIQWLLKKLPLRTVRKPTLSAMIDPQKKAIMGEQ